MNRPRTGSEKARNAVEEEIRLRAAAGVHPQGMPEAGTLITRCVSDVEARPIRWQWQNRIPRGKLTIIAGHPGLGKSQLTAFVTARVTKGGSWPDGGGITGGGQVVILTAEDDSADTVRPRLEAAGADLTRVHIVDGVIRGYSGDGTRYQRMFSLESDLAALDRKLTELKRVELVVVDPISAYLGKIDSHNNAEVRGALGPVKELAERHGAAFVAVSHMSKAGGTQALLRVTGSLAFIAAARAGYLVAADPQNDTRKLFLPLKNNLAKPQTGLAFYIKEVHLESAAGQIETSRVVWSDTPVTITADEVMAQTTPEESSALREAQEWLRDALADGPVWSKDIQKQAKENGIAVSTLRRARESLAVKTSKRPGENGIWDWELAQPPGTHNMDKLSKLDKFTEEEV
jgi:KaiC/GvpD/RAD55 family RecA-like ATPase